MGIQRFLELNELESILIKDGNFTMACNEYATRQQKMGNHATESWLEEFLLALELWYDTNKKKET